MKSKYLNKSGRNYPHIIAGNDGHKTKIILLACSLGLAVFFSGCKKYLDLDPPKTEILDASLFTSNSNADMAIAGLYVDMSNEPAFTYQLTTSAGFLSGDLNYYTTQNDAYIKNNVLPTDAGIESMWAGYYKIIYDCNSIIKNTEASTGMTDAYKKELTGEAKFIRAYAHFNLINFFGDVPLITSTNVAETAVMPRTPAADVYAQIIDDLNDAQTLLPDDYSVAKGARSRVNKWAAKALLARVYLYRKEWAKAEAQASALVNNNNLYSLLPTANISGIFVKNSREAIFQLDRAGNYAYTAEGSAFLTYAAYGIIQYPLAPSLLRSFEKGDMRKTNWIFNRGKDSTAYKYKGSSAAAPPTPESLVVLRLAEQYLIRAEARAQQNNLTGAQEDINTIRNRAGLANTSATDKIALLQAVEQERRIELFCELGHRWFDLKRWPSLINPASKTRADDVLGDLKPTWKSTAQLLPIPSNQIIKNPRLIQNPGY
ncbi:RagB/SusD family nutrient uptake outer membrane protein [Pedobacter sp. BG31]|uniref:RagB/SusD family nutrient uptake outer membrane protein n=1 Tax=Pedobacter sp. BG31 TaxID=3349697 RepID=UPI0035F2E575